ncbi:hypothetical protein [Cereibacter changlensis]|uniref:hypothetical protein n=1 Tax=Cereibacter changlensis TaxID=402884 RepID=UPI004034E514
MTSIPARPRITIVPVGYWHHDLALDKILEVREDQAVQIGERADGEIYATARHAAQLKEMEAWA